MLKIQQEIRNSSDIMYTHEKCGNVLFLKNYAKYCLWCSKPLGNILGMLNSLDLRMEYNKEGKIDNVTP